MVEAKRSAPPSVFVVDVDGVMTDGTFTYTEAGKVMKTFGPDDNDALALLEPHLSVHFVTADRRGLPISQKRIVDDMGFTLDLVSSRERLSWIETNYDPASVIYMGDGILDAAVFAGVSYGISPVDGNELACEHADHVTRSGGGHRAVAEACLHILERFFGIDAMKATSTLTTRTEVSQ